MAYKKWLIADADKEKASAISEKFNIDPFIAFLLVSRGMDSEIEVSDFLSDTYEFSDPFNFADMELAVARIEKATEYDEKITIYGDYDCDGVTSTALMFSFLKEMGANVDFYIPSREKEGYGLNKDAIDKIFENGTNLIITVDNGISAIEEAQYIYSKGMELVVTDHHQLGEKLPKAEAVINPHRTDNNLSFKELCGVGVAFKVVSAIYGDTEDMLNKYADLVAIGTIADVVPLINENRSFVRAGLNLINQSSNLGLSELRKVAGNSEKELSSTDVAFSLCPRINAAGRIDTATRAFELLTATDIETAALKAEQLGIDNTERQEIERNIFEDVKEQIKENPSLVEDRVIVLYGKNYHQGVVGIVASRVLDEYGKPTIIIGIDEDGIARGSARSIDGFNMFDAVSYCKELLLHFGGHPLAAGLSLDSKNLDLFTKKINEYAEKEHPVMPSQSLKLDCKLSPFYLNTELVDSLSILEPYGASNSQAVFALMKMNLKTVKPIGEGRHIRFEAEKKGKTIRVVKFGTTADEFPYQIGDVIDIAVKISKNLFKGKYYLSVQAVDIHKSGIDDEKYFKEKAIYEFTKIGKSKDSSVFPTREIFSTIYRFLKQNDGWKYDFESLYFNLADKVTFGQLKYALVAFEEALLLSLENNNITLLKAEKKANLEDTEIIKHLKGVLDFG